MRKRRASKKSLIRLQWIVFRNRQAYNTSPHATKTSKAIFRRNLGMILHTCPWNYLITALHIWQQIQKGFIKFFSWSQINIEVKFWCRRHLPIVVVPRLLCSADYSHIVRKFDAFSLETFRFLVLTVPSISENFHAFTVIDTTRMY